MANEFVTSEINKLINNKDWAFPLNHAMAAAYVLANFKGINLKIFDMSKAQGALCDYSVLASAANPTQSRAMIDELAKQLKAVGASILSNEGYDSADWILLDTGDIIVHVFQESARDIYDLDRVQEKNPQVKIPEEFYFGPATKVNEPNENLKGYF